MSISWFDGINGDVHLTILTDRGYPYEFIVLQREIAERWSSFDEILELIENRHNPVEEMGYQLKVIEIWNGMRIHTIIWTGANFEIDPMNNGDMIRIEKKHFPRMRLFLNYLLMKV